MGTDQVGHETQQQDDTTITVNTRPPVGMDAANSAEYTRRVGWAMEDNWDEGGIEFDKFIQFVERKRQEGEQHIRVYGDRQQPTKDNHYVPQFWLKCFADQADDNKCCIFNLDSPSCRPKIGKHRPVGSVMVEENLYNALDDTGKIHASLEESRMHMENQLAKEWADFISNGAHYADKNLGFRMMLSDYFARLFHTPWHIHTVKNSAHQVVQRFREVLPSWKADVLALEFLDDDNLIPMIRFMLFARNWTVKHLETPLALPSFPVITKGHSFIDAPTIYVPLARKVLLAMSWAPGADLTPDFVINLILGHIRALKTEYRKMAIHPADRDYWENAYNLYRRF